MQRAKRGPKLGRNVLGLEVKDKVLTSCKGDSGTSRCLKSGARRSATFLRSRRKARGVEAWKGERGREDKADNLAQPTYHCRKGRNILVAIL